MEKSKLINTFILAIIAVIILLLINSIYFYKDIKNSLEENAKREAYLLADYTISMRNTFQKAFISSEIELNEKTLSLLPAHALSKISNDFNKSNKYEFKLKNTSKRVRNPINLADRNELLAIEYFEKNNHAKEYFNKYEEDEETYYQFAMPIYVKKYCLNCHGNKKDTLESIQDSYNDLAYGYKEGDLRGIISIKIPEDSVEKRVNAFIQRNSLFLIVIISFVFIILFLLLKKTTIVLDKNEKIAKSYVMIDSLTGLYNRRFLNEFEANNNMSENCFLIFFDIDHFKLVNDNYGHLCGDFVLKEFSKKLKSFTRNEDVLCRYGGEEFVLILQNLSEDVLLAKLEDIRKNIESNNFLCCGENINITTSIGYVECNKNINFKELLHNADEALYKAKFNGRNRIEKFS